MTRRDSRRLIPRAVPALHPAAVPALLLCLALAGCGGEPMPDTGGVDPFPGAATRPSTWAGGPQAVGPLVVTHGGVGSPPDWSPDCQAAADAAMAALRTGGSVLDAAVAGTETMEDICRFNAGTGANIRLDGKTVQMDAAVMTGEGEFAAVAVIERVRNPVRVARAVLDTPHRMLAGEGATRFAHRLGFADVVPICDEAVEKYRRRMRALLEGQGSGGYESFDWRAAWNYAAPIPTLAELDGGGDGPETEDTVGTVARDASGRFAATLSTGGTTFTLAGRVGDVPIYGCGLYAGPAGAVACTGHGEEIIRRAMARTVYGMLEDGVPARAAVREACRIFGDAWSLGVIAVGRDGWGVAANMSMAYGQAARP